MGSTVNMTPLNGVWITPRLNDRAKRRNAGSRIRRISGPSVLWRAKALPDRTSRWAKTNCINIATASAKAAAACHAINVYEDMESPMKLMRESGKCADAERPPHVPKATCANMDGMKARLAMNAKQISLNCVLESDSVSFANENLCTISANVRRTLRFENARIHLFFVKIIHGLAYPAKRKLGQAAIRPS